VIYVEGYSLITAIGETANKSAHRLKNYTYKIEKLDNKTKYYKIPNIKQLEYYDIIEKTIRDAIKDAELSEESLKEAALFIGTSSAKLPLNEMHAINSGELLKDIHIDEVTDIIAKRTGIGGFKTIISTACTSSSNALIQAKEMIESGLIDKAIVVGIELYNELSIRGFESFMLLSKDKIKPFDKNRDGIILGEAVSAIVLGKNESCFELAGGAIKVDTSSITAPTPENLTIVMDKAIRSANISAQDIIAIKTHSTATRQNDEAEAKGIHLIFHKKIPQIVTLKPYIGHTMGACGTNELVLLLAAMRQGFIPKNIYFESMDSECMIVPSTDETIARRGYYLLNYFGFGGNNSSIVLKYKGE